MMMMNVWDYAKHEPLTVGSRIILNLLAAHGFTPTCDLSWQEYFKMQDNNFSNDVRSPSWLSHQKMQVSLIELLSAHPEYLSIAWANHEVDASGEIKDITLDQQLRESSNHHN